MQKCHSSMFEGSGCVKRKRAPEREIEKERGKARGCVRVNILFSARVMYSARRCSFKSFMLTASAAGQWGIVRLVGCFVGACRLF